ncbi:MAG: hypothetical protein V1817_00515 [Candidatus Micrarchaeota archaeon]
MLLLPRTLKGNRFFGGRPVTAAIRTSPRFKKITALVTSCVFGAVYLFHPLGDEGKGFVFARRGEGRETEREGERERKREREPLREDASAKASDTWKSSPRARDVP